MIFFVGIFPPPVNGMSMVNQAAYNRLLAEGWAVNKLDTSPKNLKRDLFSRLSRVLPVVKAWAALFRIRKSQDLLYIAISGEWGQIYDLVSLAIARLKGARRFIHHHNFVYLQRQSVLTGILFRVAGKEAIHIVLCGEMGRALQSRYGADCKTLLLSNLVFFSSENHVLSRSKLSSIGFLSNITKEKGGEIILELAFEIKKRGIPLDVIIAGPCEDNDLIQRFHEAESKGALQWLGGVYGKDKIKFWDHIDAFIFPTRYGNEAEPLVVWEGLAAGIPVITYRRGCIGEQLEDVGMLVLPDEDFVSVTLGLLELWQRDEHTYQHVVRKAQVRYRLILEKSACQWKELQSRLFGI